MANNQPNPKRDEGGQSAANPKSKAGNGSSKGTSSGGTPGAKLPNEKPLQGSATSKGAKK